MNKLVDLIDNRAKAALIAADDLLDNLSHSCARFNLSPDVGADRVQAVVVATLEIDDGRLLVVKDLMDNMRNIDFVTQRMTHSPTFPVINRSAEVSCGALPPRASTPGPVLPAPPLGLAIVLPLLA